MEIAAVVGKRVSLRPIRGEDLAAIEIWFDEAVATARIRHHRLLSRSAGEWPSIGAETSGALVIERLGESEPIGLVEYALGDSWLTVVFIALAKAYRGWGYGSEAVRLLEEWAVHERLAERFEAEVTVENGLGLYFWLRLGYRLEGPEDASGWRTQRMRDRMRMVRFVNEARGKR